MNTSEQHIATRPFLVNLTYFSDQFPPDHTDIIKEFKTLYLMIKAKSRFCKGVNSKKKHRQNTRAGYDYNSAL